jgi:hypothetical protein
LDANAMFCSFAFCRQLDRIEEMGLLYVMKRKLYKKKMLIFVPIYSERLGVIDYYNEMSKIKEILKSVW